MNKAMLSVGIIILSITALALINLIVNASTSSELDYYLVKETVEAAMIDAIDSPATGENVSVVRMDKEEFVESFVKRFAMNVDPTREYTIGFYDLNETPPKASVKVGSSTLITFENTSADIVTQVDSIIETNNEVDEFSEFNIEQNNIR